MRAVAVDVLARVQSARPPGHAGRSRYGNSTVATTECRVGPGWVRSARATNRKRTAVLEPQQAIWIAAQSGITGR